MAEDPQESTADSQPDTSLDTRVGKLEAGQDSLTAKIDDILGILKGSGGDGDGDGGHEEQATGGTNIAHEIRAQLDDAERKRAAQERDKAHGDRLAGLEAKITEMSEKPPEAPVKRSTRMMWGRP